MWVADIGYIDGEKNQVRIIDCIPVTVSNSATKLSVQETKSGVVINDKVKTVTLSKGETNLNTLRLLGLAADQSVADEADYVISMTEGGEEYLDAQLIGDELRLTAINSKDKSVKVKVKITCLQSGRAVTITVVIYNRITSVTATLAPDSGDELLREGDRVTLNVSAVAGDMEYTVKPRLYVVDDTKAVTMKKGKLVYTKSNAVSAKLSNGVLTITRKDIEKSCAIYLLYKDSVTGEARAYRVCSVEAVTLSGGKTY